MRLAATFLLCLTLLSAGCTRSGGFTFTQVTYTLQGGIGGLDMEMTVRQDGSVQVTEQGKAGKQFKLSGSDLRALKELMAKVNWLLIDPRYTDPAIADAVFQGLLITGAGKRDYVTVVGTGGTPPPELAAVLAHLQVILKEHRPE